MSAVAAPSRSQPPTQQLQTSYGITLTPLDIHASLTPRSVTAAANGDVLPLASAKRLIGDEASRGQKRKALPDNEDAGLPAQDSKRIRFDSASEFTSNSVSHVGATPTPRSVSNPPLLDEHQRPTSFSESTLDTSFWRGLPSGSSFGDDDGWSETATLHHIADGSLSPQQTQHLNVNTDVASLLLRLSNSPQGSYGHDSELSPEDNLAIDNAIAMALASPLSPTETSGLPLPHMVHDESCSAMSLVIFPHENTATFFDVSPDEDEDEEQSAIAPSDLPLSQRIGESVLEPIRPRRGEISLWQTACIARVEQIIRLYSVDTIREAVDCQTQRYFDAATTSPETEIQSVAKFTSSPHSNAYHVLSPELPWLCIFPVHDLSDQNSMEARGTPHILAPEARGTAPVRPPRKYRRVTVIEDVDNIH